MGRRPLAQITVPCELLTMVMAANEDVPSSRNLGWSHTPPWYLMPIAYIDEGLKAIA